MKINRPSFLFALVSFVFLSGCTETTEPETALPVPDDRNMAVVVQTEAGAPGRFEEIMRFAQDTNLHEKEMGEIVQVLGEQFRGSPYVAGMLDAPSEETLVVSFEEFDCVLYIETVLALARNVAVRDYSYASFVRNLEDQRYRDGRLDGYCSRLHYFSEWILNNEQRGNVSNVTASLGGIRLAKTLNFMSTHRDSYSQLIADELFDGIVEMENELKGTEIYYIPQDRIKSVYDRLQAGDLIAAVTDIEGLDVAHTGMVYDFGDGRKGFQHASVSEGVTVVTDLQAYITGVRRQIGVVVVRPSDPRTRPASRQEF